MKESDTMHSNMVVGYLLTAVWLIYCSTGCYTTHLTQRKQHSHQCMTPVKNKLSCLVMG